MFCVISGVNTGTLLRVALPSALAAMVGYAYFDNISLFLYQNWLSAGIYTLYLDPISTPCILVPKPY